MDDALSVQKSERLQQLAEDALHTQSVPGCKRSQRRGLKRLNPRAQAAEGVEGKNEVACAAFLEAARQTRNQRMVPLLRVLRRGKKRESSMLRHLITTESRINPRYTGKSDADGRPVAPCPGFGAHFGTVCRRKPETPS